MELDKCIKKRRSIRSYLDKDVSWKLLYKIIDAAHYAPSSGNLQNWRFIVVKDQQKRAKLSHAALNQHWMTEAPVHIVVCSDNRNIKRQYEKDAKKYIEENCAAAIQNILLKAYDLGLGTCWVGSFNSTLAGDVIEIKDYAEVIGIITLGYSAETPISKRHKIQEITYFEKYGNLRRISKEFISQAFPLQKYNKKVEKTISKIKDKIKKKFKK